MRPLKKVSDSQTQQQYILRPAHINPYGRLFGAQLLKWIDEVASVYRNIYQDGPEEARNSAEWWTFMYGMSVEGENLLTE